MPQPLECPHCREPITAIDAHRSVRGNEVGYLYLPFTRGNQERNPAEIVSWEDDDFTHTGRVQFSCPSCGHNLTTRQLERLNQAATRNQEIQLEQQERELGIARRTRAGGQGSKAKMRPPHVKEADGEGEYMVLGTQHKRFKKELTGQSMVECPHCRHAYEDELDYEMICPSCHKTWQPENKQEIAKEPRINQPSTEQTSGGSGFFISAINPTRRIRREVFLSEDPEASETIERALETLEEFN